MKRFGSERGLTQPLAASSDADSPERNAGAARRRIGYFSHLTVGEKHIGAILVTNQIGVPLEFKYTEPITATRLHKVLYGAALDRHLRETVIRDRLAAEIRTDPELYVARFEEREFLASLGGREMIAVERASAAGVDHGEPFMRVREREALMGFDEGPALRIAFSTPDAPAQQEIARTLQELAQTMDLLEPFDRLKTALTMLCSDERKGR